MPTHKVTEEMQPHEWFIFNMILWHSPYYYFWFQMTLFSFHLAPSVFCCCYFIHSPITQTLAFLLRSRVRRLWVRTTRVQMSNSGSRLLRKYRSFSLFHTRYTICSFALQITDHKVLCYEEFYSGPLLVRLLK